MDVIKEKWEEIIQKLKVEYFLSNISFETWIRPLEVYEIRGNTLYLTVNFKASIEHIQNKYLLPLKVCIAEVTGTEYQIKFIPRDQCLVVYIRLLDILNWLIAVRINVMKFAQMDESAFNLMV